MKTRFLLLLLALITAVSLFVSCGGETPETPSGGETGGETGGESGGETGGESGATVNYTITWVDENGTTLTTTTVKEGDTPSYTYNKADTAEWDYTLDGWCATAGGEVLSSIPAASANATYYAKISKTKQVYTVSFSTGDGSKIDSQSVEYGGVATEPATAPELDGFRFVGWSTAANGGTEVDFTAVITGNVTYYAIWNEKVEIGDYLAELLSGYSLNPYSYIPESMQPAYAANLIDPSAASIDYSSFVNVSSIPSRGFGEQWNMVLDNLQQSMTFFNVLSVVDTLATSSIVAFNNYIDSNPEDTSNYNFLSGIYSVTIKYDGNSIYYVLDYTATIPALGEQSVQIALDMNTATKVKNVRVQIGDANALAYTVSDDAYDFAIKYLGVRRAYFSVEKNTDGSVNGHIYEYIVVSSVEVASAADFYITDDYVSAVGNKADGMIGFTGYISELYNAESGKMIGYEVKETLSSITYNTIWFDIHDVDGINSIKYVPATDDETAKLFVNGSSNAWETKNVGGFSLKALSRRFDIEFRTQYFYSYDAANDTYVKYALSIPMLFVQEENYDTLVDDVKAENKITISIGVTNKNLAKLLADYDTLIDVFIANKEGFTVDFIVERIGNKVTFS